VESEALAALATGRVRSLFAGDVAEKSEELRAAIAGSRVLVVGGAGSIGAATVKAILAFSPRSLHVIDQNENSLAELVRSLRAARDGLTVRDFKAAPLDFGSPVTKRFLGEQEPYDFVLNFAALKHVRSEKDVPSLLQLLDTNLLKATRLIQWLVETGSVSRYFSVSTDKAANPTNLMGASKRAMEQLVFAEGGPAREIDCVTSARFANVAFSAGSLLESFLFRLEKRQPFGAPRDTRRFFVSSRESGEICLLAAVLGPCGYLLVPRLDPDSDLVAVSAVAEAVIRHHGMEPAVYTDEKSARERVDADIAVGKYPLLLTELDTTGEKPFEEFVANGEVPEEVGFSALLGLKPRTSDARAISRLLQRIREAVDVPHMQVDKNQIVEWIREVVPELAHTETGLTLDARI
jgi:FlaA1/EpsC-like NDP-sugar epimerase